MHRLIADCIDKINAKLENAERIVRFGILENDFPTDVRSVTAFQKVKIDRRAVEHRYQREINEIYEIGSQKGAA